MGFKKVADGIFQQGKIFKRLRICLLLRMGCCWVFVMLGLGADGFMYCQVCCAVGQKSESVLIKKWVFIKNGFSCGYKWVKGKSKKIGSKVAEEKVCGNKKV